VATRTKLIDPESQRLAKLAKTACEEISLFDYLTELQRHARELASNPAEWMPWNYRETLARD
jgi:hypothetical protein